MQILGPGEPVPSRQVDSRVFRPALERGTYRQTGVRSCAYVLLLL